MPRLEKTYIHKVLFWKNGSTYTVERDIYNISKNGAQTNDFCNDPFCIGKIELDGDTIFIYPSSKYMSSRGVICLEIPGTEIISILYYCENSEGGDE